MLLQYITILVQIQILPIFISLNITFQYGLLLLIRTLILATDRRLSSIKKIAP